HCPCGCVVPATDRPMRPALIASADRGRNPGWGVLHALPSSPSRIRALAAISSSAVAATVAADDPRAGLLARFEAAGYRRAAPAILQPAEPFLDLSGEDIRRRMLLTSDAEGREFCLR